MFSLMPPADKDFDSRGADQTGAGEAHAVPGRAGGAAASVGWHGRTL